MNAPSVQSVQSNVLLDYATQPDRHGGLPPFKSITAADVVPAVDALLAALATGQRALEAAIEAKTAAGTVGYVDVVEALADLTEPVERGWGVVGHLMGVKNTPELRAAQQVAQPKIVMAMMQLAQSEVITRALTAVQQREAATLTPARRRIVEKKLLEARLAGIALAGPEKERFNAIETELSELQTRFSNHVLDATKAWSLTLSDVDDVRGLPSSWKQMATTSGDAERGPWKLTLDFPSFQPFMKYGERRDLRERAYRAYLARASDLDGGAADNRPLIARILDLRQEKARLLGFDSFAAVSLATKMAPSTTAVRALLSELRAVALPVAREELNELRVVAAKDGLDDVRHWDIEYYAEKLRAARYAYSEEDLRSYFAFPAVLDGLFSLINRLFAVDVRDATAEVDVWHDDVRFYRVSKGGKDVAAFYLDPYARPADKRPGAWMDDAVTRRALAAGTRLPVAYLVCNQPPPVGGKPALLPFRDVETLFHEFGHGLQHMLTSVVDVDASGIRGVEWDAVELPSQFMENWCTDDATLAGFARHTDTGAPLPADLLQKLKAQKTFRQASMTLRQLLFATVDLDLHEHHVDNVAAGRDAFAVQRRVAEENAVLPVLDGDRFLCSFSHIFAGGYAAGYYSYKWAEVLSADAFAAFEEAGLDDDAQVRATGARFRDTVLALGGSVHPGEVFRQFRGRDPSTTALLRHAGLLKA